ncbi:MAG: DUF933 domain-containing protein [Chloroflexi bacterium]|nr:DUF933 domain-containing protein [Chloroflexota bacterium]
MKLGLVGLRGSGKSSILGALLGRSLSESNTGVGTIKVPDPVLVELSKIYNPKKLTFATLECIELPAPGEKEKKVLFSQAAQKLDAVVTVTGAFRHPDKESILSEFQSLRQELQLMDLVFIETRKERVLHDARTFKEGRAAKLEEQELLDRLSGLLESGKDASEFQATDAEMIKLKEYNLITSRPRIAILNISEEQMKDAGELEKMVSGSLEAGPIPVFSISAPLEIEVCRMDPCDIEEFMEELGIKVLGRDRLIERAYGIMKLQSFYTVGEDEVRAWTIREGDSALEAAGKIHTDLMRGFIRAEVVPADALLRLGSWNGAKEEGSFHLEGRDYIVQNGDIVHIRFNV